jgi:hypothetical protein
MKKILPLGFIVIAALILAACGAPMMRSEPAYGGAAPPVPQVEVMEAAPQADFDQSATSNSGSGFSAASMERIVIQNADLTIVVSDVKGRMKDIQVMAQQMGGYVVSSNLGQSYTRNNVQVPEAQITIRVPAEKLDEALEQIKKDVVEVQNETRSGQDVTAEYVDLQSRLKNYEAAEAQLERILETATETEDVINTFNQLVYYREQIELVKGQMKYYEEAAALSAISIRIIAEETVQPVVIGKWEPKGVALEAFVDFVIRFVIFILPALITICGPIYLVFLGGRFVFRKVRGNKPKVEKVEQPQTPPDEK